jgi:hypothetical protein
VLLEVDTSDCQGQLSTMLLIPRFDINSDKWRSELRNLETKLIKQSLNWPTDYFKKNYAGKFVRIKHPRKIVAASRRTEWLRQWGERVYTAAVSILNI